MAVTVRALADLEIMKEKTELVAGFSGLDRIVNFVTIMEAPDFDKWVDGGEFVLTTWYAFSQRPELQYAAFNGLADKIAAIGIKTGRFISKIPEEIIRLANERGVPVFAIDRGAKFREIIQAIAGEINNHQTSILFEVDRHYQKLAKAALADGDISVMLRGLGERGRFSCYCLNPNMEVIGSYLPPGKTAFSPATVERHLKQCCMASSELPSYFRTDDLHIFPCHARRLSLGFLVIQSREVLSEKFRLMAGNLAIFLTLKLLDDAETEQKNLSNLLDDILYRHRLNEEELLSRLSSFGLKKQNGFRAIILKYQENNQGLPRKVQNYAAYFKNILNDAVQVVKPDEIVYIATAAALDHPKRYPQWLKTVKAKDIQCPQEVIVSIGPAVMSAKEIQASYRIARQTLRVAGFASASGILYYGDYIVSNLLSQTADTLEYRLLYDRVIAPLITPKHCLLMDTLAAVAFTEDIDTAANEMGIHSNTIRYRLRKIAELTGYDFFVPQGRYVLTTACLIYRSLPKN